MARRRHSHLRAWLCLVLLVVGRASDAGDENPTTALDSLVRDAVRLVGDRYSQPIGHVVERRRGRVFVAIHGQQPTSGARLLAMRPIPEAPPGRERLIARLHVQRTTRGLVECKEVDRSGRAHVEKGDVVRVQRDPVRLLLAPCISVVDIAPVVPQVVGEKLRTAILGRMDVDLVEDGAAERAAEAAHWSGSLPDFVRGLDGVDEVLVPVLLQTPGRLLLNLEYYTVERARAVHVDVALVEADAMLRAWLRAGNPRRKAPPGFRLLTTQVFPWHVTALAAAPHSGLLAATRDSLHVLDFAYPGLQPRRAFFLGPSERPRRSANVLMLVTDELDSVESLPDHTTWILSDARRPHAIVGGNAESGLRIESATEPLESSRVLEDLWVSTRGPTPMAAQWWPSPSRGVHPIIQPLFADVDGDGRVDLVWSDTHGVLHVQRVATHRVESFAGFGDVKAVQPGTTPDSRAVLWLTDPVCCGAADRLHATQLVDQKLRVAWSSEPFQATLAALVSHDLNGDTARDLVVAEALPNATRLYVFLALPGEHTPARGTALRVEGGG